MGDLMNRSFRFEENRRSNTFGLALELGFTRSRSMPYAYEKLSDSNRFVESGRSNHHGSRYGFSWAFVAKIFSLKKAACGGGDSSDTRRRSAEPSSWRPDPNCRWPVQGW